MDDSNLNCQQELRREDVRVADLFGLDYVEVGDVEGTDDQRILHLFFLGKAPPDFKKENMLLTGGRRIRDVHITNLRVVRQKDPTFDDYLEIEVDKTGDFSPYTLAAIEIDENGKPTGQPMPGFDQRYSRVTFTFKGNCPSDLDCKRPNVCPPPERNEPDINYLAKDYASFRQLILDRLALIMPDWSETHVPDIGLTLVELLAYAGDYLSYYQDAVATEAYLGTARERISVRRHARLVDYSMHEGCNARTWITLWTSDKAELDPAQIYFITPFLNAPEDHVLSQDDLRGIPSLSYDIFEPLTTGIGVPPDGSTISIFPAHNEIHFYTWGDCECCLQKGSTSATLVDGWVELAPPVEQPAPDVGAGEAKAPTGDKTNPHEQTRVAASRAPRALAAGESRSASVTDSDMSGSSDEPPGTERILRLNVGDVLIFEEVKGAKNGISYDADPQHRQAVRLTKVTPLIDPLYHPYSDTFGPEFGQPLLEIEWASEDALTFPLCISSQEPPPDCGCMEDVSVARGNVVLVDHGGDVSEPLGTVPTQSTTETCPSCCRPADVQIVAGLFRPVLSQQPLTYSEPLESCGASDSLEQYPRQCLPWITLVSIPPGPDCIGALNAPPPSADEASDGSNDDPPVPPCEIDPLFTFDDLTDPTGLAKALRDAATVRSQFLLAQLNVSTRTGLSEWDGIAALPDPLRSSLLADLIGMLETWSPRADLLESGPGDRVFVAEIDNDGFAHIRFGDGVSGRQPEAGTAFRADYCIGNGKSGNVGAETLTYIVFRNEKLNGVEIKPRNPFPAIGGQEPEPIDQVKMLAPFSFKSLLERAVTADDYATLAADNGRRLKARSAQIAVTPGICASPFQRLQGTKANLRWNGSWYTAQIALDPEGAEDADSLLISEITDYLSPFRRMGHDLLVGPARYVPLKLVLSVCVKPNYLRGHVEAAVLDVLSDRRLPNGALGFFHPDNLTFGSGIFVSKLLASVQVVAGVQDVTINELERLEITGPGGDVDEELPANSVLRLGPTEIARLDNDPDFPENGQLVLNLRGGR